MRGDSKAIGVSAAVIATTLVKSRYEIVPFYDYVVSGLNPSDACTRLERLWLLTACFPIIWTNPQIKKAIELIKVRPGDALKVICAIGQDITSASSSSKKRKKKK